MHRMIATLAVAAAVLACSKKEGETVQGQSAADLGAEKTLGPISLRPPSAWVEEPPTSNMRAAQWSIPGESGAAELVVFYFGAGGAGGVEANLDRWYGQFQQADGAPSRDRATTSTREVSGMKVTLADVSGRYVAAVQPGAAAHHDEADYRMLAAIVETSGGPYYFKMVGPDKTVSAAKQPFDAMIESMKPSP